MGKYRAIIIICLGSDVQWNYTFKLFFHLIRLLFGACLNKEFYLFFTTRRGSCCLFVKIRAFIKRALNRSLCRLDTKKQMKEFCEFFTSCIQQLSLPNYRWVRSWENLSTRLNSIELDRRVMMQNMTKYWSMHDD